MKSTGFKAYNKTLDVGDIVTLYDGYGGYFEIVEKNGEYWVVDCNHKVYGIRFPDDELNEPFKLKRNLDIHWKKVDKNNPLRTPPIEIECECCDSVVGEFDLETGEYTWLHNCVSHEEIEENQILAYCSTCYPERETKIKPGPKLSEIEEYFWQKYENASFRVVPGHWPDFQSKEEVDKWIEDNDKMTKYFLEKIK